MVRLSIYVKRNMQRFFCIAIKTNNWSLINGQEAIRKLSYIYIYVYRSDVKTVTLRLHVFVVINLFKTSSKHFIMQLTSSVSSV